MGWNGSGAGKTRLQTDGVRNSARRNSSAGSRNVLVVGVTIAVVCAIGLLVMFFRGDGETKADKGKSDVRMIKEAKPAAAPVYKETPPEEKKPTAEDRARIRAEIMKLSPEERYERVLQRLRKVGLPDQPRSNRLFRSSIEQKMAMIFTTEPGDPLPAFPPRMTLHDEAFLAEILIGDNPIVDGDDDRAKMKKEAVQLAKKELIQYIKEGGDPDDFLEYHYTKLKQAHQEFADARKSVFETLKNDPDIAGPFIKKVNERLRARGIKEIVIPQKALDHFNVQLED